MPTPTPWVCAAMALAFAACGAKRSLVGDDGHQRLTALDAESGVTVVATMGAWQASPPTLADEVTVVHILVANNGKQPILLAPGDLALKDRRGFRYDLLDAGATFHVPADDSQGPREGPDVDGGANGAPQYQPYDRAMDQDYDLGAAADVQWFEADGDIAALALPWGVLQPRTQMRGFLYFEPMAANANGGTLTWKLGTPDHVPVVDAVFKLAVANGRE